MKVSKLALLYREDLPDLSEEEIKEERASPVQAQESSEPGYLPEPNRTGWSDVDWGELTSIVRRSSAMARDLGPMMAVVQRQPIQDVHHRTAQALFNVDYASMEQRVAARTVNFGSLYGSNARTMGGALQMDLERSMVDAFRASATIPYTYAVEAVSTPPQPTRQTRLDRSMYQNLPGMDRSWIRSSRQR